LKRTTQLQDGGPSLASMTTYQDNKAIREVGSVDVRFIPHCEQINAIAFQLKLLGSMKIHPMFHVSLLESYHVSTIRRKIHDPLPRIEIDGE
jgi:hypothetical protein